MFEKFIKSKTNQIFRVIKNIDKIGIMLHYKSKDKIFDKHYFNLKKDML